MNNLIIDLNYLIELFEDYDQTEIGTVVWTVLMKIQNDDLDLFNLPELEHRDLRALARALLQEYRRNKIHYGTNVEKR